MEYKGRIARLFQTEEGKSQRTGNDWRALPFVFEYYENESDRFADSAFLKTFDTKVMAAIAPFVLKDADGKAIIENGEMKLTRNVEVRCGFGHLAKQYEGRFYNELRLYKMEVLTKVEKPAADAACTVAEGTSEADASSTVENIVEKGDSFAELKTVGDGDELPF